ncbi:MAG: diguanylate cyclase [Methylotenera sp.]|uniref:diguanylate cyclase domain-containing protein n=1 Tax=Methylotenera sp. TaxID=2051956 RepID=UPI0024875041|nr:diguanylate cyclase [Methylotenera sp.]MDI1310334.1 diguanylate cyclase [Methylotenera sp.]
MSLNEICSSNPISVSQDTMLSDVLEVMANMTISSVVVVEGRRPVGIFTERDALRIIPELLDPSVTKVGSLMSGNPVVAPKHLDLFEAYHICAQKNIRHLIVVNDEGDLHGIASDTDFMKVLGLDVFSGQEKVENVMSTDASSLSVHASLNDAIVLMVKSNARAVVITDAGKPVGIITERDLVRLGRNHVASNTLLADVMSNVVVTVQRSRSTYFAIELMRQHQIRTLAVVDEDGVFQGLLTEHDVVKKIENRYVSILNTIIKRQAHDIERIRQELDEKHVLSAVLHESLGVCLIIADPANNVRYLNPAASALFGLTHESIVGEHLELLFDKIGMATEELRVALDKAKHGTIYEFDITHQIRNDIVHLHVRIAPIQDQNNHLLGFVQTIQDETEKKLSERKLKQAASIFENTIEGTIITDADVNILSVNPAFTRITGYEEEEVRGKNPNILSSGRQDNAFFKRLWESLQTSGYWQGELWNRRKSGETYAEWLTISVILDADDKVKNYIAVFADITSSKIAHDEFEFLAHHDPLTKLPNRLLFNARLSHSLSRIKRTGDNVALLMIDLDGFKFINDQFGHQAGDRVLEVVAERLLANTRSEDTVARLGGDEFVVVLEDIMEITGATDIAHKLIQEISQPIVMGVNKMTVTASVGIALSSMIGDNPKLLISSADDALYRAKDAGKNKFICA